MTQNNKQTKKHENSHRFRCIQYFQTSYAGCLIEVANGQIGRTYYNTICKYLYASVSWWTLFHLCHETSSMNDSDKHPFIINWNSSWSHTIQRSNECNWFIWNDISNKYDWHKQAWDEYVWRVRWGHNGKSMNKKKNKRYDVNHFFLYRLEFVITCIIYESSCRSDSIRYRNTEKKITKIVYSHCSKWHWFATNLAIYLCLEHTENLSTN